jgi:hypothetical protein
MRKLLKTATPYLFLFITYTTSVKGQIDFCGEPLPLSKKTVADQFLQVVETLQNKCDVTTFYKRAALYFDYVEEMLYRFGIPDDFKYLPLIESAFHNYGPNQAGAAGVWQITPETAKMFGGLIINKYLDERLDFEKATVFALKLIQWLYERLGSWTLTAAAYNGGIGRIETKINKLGHRNYYTMGLCKETSEYVLKMVAFKELFVVELNFEIVIDKVILLSLKEEGNTTGKNTIDNDIFNSKIIKQYQDRGDTTSLFANCYETKEGYMIKGRKAEISGNKSTVKPERPARFTDSSRVQEKPSGP